MKKEGKGEGERRRKARKKEHSLRGMRHYLWSARCNTVSVNFTQKWQEINCSTIPNKLETMFNTAFKYFFFAFQVNAIFYVYAKPRSL